ncbi:MAG: TRAP transporter small permease [Spirochaetales bacterium]|jgi:TRAP-type C4-dicarboxylate transport system permease small subunit|nr:TRAP transporter small permease [Spirochaetales bacterium]
MKTLNSLIKYVLVVMLAVMFILTTVQVILRYGFNTALSWSEELVRFLFVWATFLGAAIGVREHIHIGVDAVVNLLPASLRRYADTLVYLVIFTFGIVLVCAGIPVVTLTHGQLSPALEMPMSYVYIAIPIAGVFAMLYALAEVVLIWKKRKAGEG